jgi:hypothetical protein
MPSKADIATLSRVASLGVFRGVVGVEAGVSRQQLSALRKAGVIERILPDTYRFVSVARSNAQDLRAALLWAGGEAASAGRSAGEVYELEGVRASDPRSSLRKGTARDRRAVWFTTPNRWQQSCRACIEESA